MASGSFQSMNKKRAGFYSNFKGVPTPLTNVGTRGIVALPIPLSWGDGLIEVLSTDLVDGKVEDKLGYTIADPELQLVRLALTNAHKALVYRVDSGGVKASATIGQLTVAAAFAGVLGNQINITTEVKGTELVVTTYFKGVKKDTQTVTALQDLVDNGYVEFEGTGTAFVASAGTSLASGTNGTVNAAGYTAAFDRLRSKKWNVLAVPTEDTAVVTAAELYIKTLREDVGKKVQAIISNKASDYEGIISTKGQGFITNDETVSPLAFVVYVAGAQAGAAVNQSLTYHKIIGAVDIVNPLDDAQIIESLNDGYFVLSERDEDGAIVFESDINTLVTLGQDKNDYFTSNRSIRTLDEIHNTCRAKFEVSYIGAVDNDKSGRNIYKADLIDYLNRLQGMGAIQNFDSTTDIEVLEGTGPKDVIINLKVQPTEAMEKAYMTVLVGKKD